MKIIKPITFKIAFVLIFFSCSNTSENSNNPRVINYKEITSNVESYTESFRQDFNSVQSIESKFNEFFETNKLENTSKKELKQTNENLKQQFYIEVPDYYSDDNTKTLLAFYNSMANAYDYEILNIINDYKFELVNNLLPLNLEEKAQFLTILDASSYAVEMVDEILAEKTNKEQKDIVAKGGCGFWCCMRKTAGKKIGRGIAGGAIFGAIGGGIIGGAGGTIALPGFGTAGGAVGGAVYGAAKGASNGAILGVLWAAADCLPQAQLDNTVYLSPDIVIADFFGDNSSLTIDSTLLNLDDKSQVEILNL